MKNVKCKKCGSIANFDYGEDFDCDNCGEHEDAYADNGWDMYVIKFSCECGGELMIDWDEGYNEDDFWKEFDGMRCSDCGNEDWKYKE